MAKAISATNSKLFSIEGWRKRYSSGRLAEGNFLRYIPP